MWKSNFMLQIDLASFSDTPGCRRPFSNAINGKNSGFFPATGKKGAGCVRQMMLSVANWTVVFHLLCQYFFEAQFGAKPSRHTFYELGKRVGEIGDMAFENSFKFDQGFVIKSDGFYFGEVNICKL